MPRVSVIIAAFHSQDFIGQAIDSVLAQSFADFEILIAPDEPGDYSAFAGRDPRIRVLPGVPRPTGPGPTRNRALERAAGDWIALLDDDDLWSPGYLEALVPAAEAHGAALGVTSVRDEGGEELRRIPARPEPEATFATFAGAYASFHAVTRRSAERRWRAVLAEDVLFDMESLSLAGGRAPVCEAARYNLRVRPLSATRSAAFLSGIGVQYAELAALIRGNRTGIERDHHSVAAAVFETWAEMNERFLRAREQAPNLAYQAFVCSLIG